MLADDEAPRGTLRVLAVVDAQGSREHAALAATLEHVVVEEGDRVAMASSVEEAVALAKAAPVDVAFVQLQAAGGAAIALCHHLPNVSPGVLVHAIVDASDLSRGPEALSLGASGVLVAPLTGDAIARTLASVKEQSARSRQVDLLEEKLSRERRRLETYDRLVRFARGAAQSDAVRTIVEGVAQVSEARGVALFATFGDEESERVRLAAMGTALDLPSNASPADLSRLVQARRSRVLPLVAGGGELAILVLDQAPPLPEPEMASLADLAAAMLLLVDRHDQVDESVRVFPPKQFRSVAERMLTLASRHDRRAAVLAITLPASDRSKRREEITLEIADIVRNTDAVCGSEEGDLLVFLPETTALGAHMCRRRILARLRGDRRARPSVGSPRAQEPRSKRPPISIGVASFPHDGATLKRLVRTARARSVDDGRSSVHALGLETLSLSELVDALLARPMFDAGPRSPYPLDLAAASLFALVTRACREAARGGQTRVVSTLQPGLGVAAAARQASSPRVVDARTEPGCEDVEAIVVEAEHGTWACCGRLAGGRFRGVHAADPLLADLIALRLGGAGGIDAG